MKKRLLYVMIAAVVWAGIMPASVFAASFNMTDTIQPYAKSSAIDVKVYPSTGASSVSVAGTSYKNAVTIDSGGGASTSANFNLGGKYSTLTGILGAQDGETYNESYTLGVNFYGDGTLLSNHSVSPVGLPGSFSLNVTGVADLKIEVVSPDSGRNIRDYPVVLASLVLTDAAAAVPAPADTPLAVNSSAGTPSVMAAAPGPAVNLIDTMVPYMKSSTAGYIEYYPTAGAKTAAMAGVSYKNALAISSSGGLSTYAHFNLDGQYAAFTGIFGAQDGETIAGSYTLSLNFYGDGVLLGGYTVNPTGMPQNFAVDTTGVGDLKIEVVSPYSGANIRDYPVVLANLSVSALPGPRRTPQAKTGGVAMADTMGPIATSNKDYIHLYPTTGASSVKIAGQEYKNAVTIDSSGGASTSADFNLGGAYTKLDTIIGAQQGEVYGESYTLMANFYGDGRLLSSIEVTPAGLPKAAAVDVTGVRNLKIEVVSPYSGSNIRDYPVVFGDLRLNAPVQ